MLLYRVAFCNPKSALPDALAQVYFWVHSVDLAVSTQ